MDTTTTMAEEKKIPSRQQQQESHEEEISQLKKTHEAEITRLKRQFEKDRKAEMADVYRRVGEEMAGTRAKRETLRDAGIDKLSLSEQTRRAVHHPAVVWPMRYFDEFILMRCNSDLLDSGGNTTTILNHLPHGCLWWMGAWCGLVSYGGMLARIAGQI